ncbi:Wadjet anti-phage system protein JetD domain-containing protein [Lelliottia amnigena]|uniref:Wadjet anti-phage system protein JetD domain-containing protein n=1 Tax=Lelliottia amnigena TaxID=61646 RepID=UPI0040562147
MNPKFELEWLVGLLNKRWQRYEFHLAWLGNQLTFPLTLALPKVTGRQLMHDFSLLQDQLARLVQQCAQKGLHLDIKEFQFSSMGRQRLPVSVQIPSMEILVQMLGQKTVWQSFCQDIELLRLTYPQLESWFPDQVALIVRHHGKWPRLLAVCRYFQLNPRPMRYIRALDIASVDSKFIEFHKPVLKLLLDNLLPSEAIVETLPPYNRYAFEHRYGLLHDLPSIRFRLLDNTLAQHFNGLSDLNAPVDQLAKMALPIQCVVITENKTNFLALPEMGRSIAIFGLGYGVQLLKQIPWLARTRILYWGDIDTNGFAILSQLRSYFPQTESLLMDEDTLLACREVWGEEPAENICRVEVLPGLQPQEQQLYEKLKQNFWQKGVRLEQEYIPFLRLQQALSTLCFI